ncbi:MULTISPECIES: 3-deoxy-7-phosphoheptulonate synthase [Pseudonocardia]|uniref:Phospho-2-dehydro-3-deoxyheptonate aldolase n=2 Tax=Pseudonocardia TaxID=1847 RepID=A0A1Y2N5F3_PSEAH|nr:MULTISPECIES: 3-deoxy-7-phosphoheptulonate synthase [Pseudonocardia]OSY42399.1 Phospho-2-dehydro-3-deoxyheptonate aldolase, Phe-sensitive [Pseudonocardia autotrophica]TDN75919.1 3-deoxy-D-arabinoheptulosonate-7-phosphate synthase [Pseudonocardia autotrophica]BBF99891.1 phospho-2-dehydro-3-deoxyheptonate aldolase [Pseudonocardia autotrophica]GEC28892.1 phospho-2-dehydro-3-deoxyheptonate aldolase [Pseudonocardia saturnea]
MSTPTAPLLDTPLDDRRIERIRPLISPALLRHDLPCTPEVAGTVTRGRAAVTGILDGTDDRLLVVVGPCSVHDPDAALDYARRLAARAEELSGELCIVMRTYFEKPRTTVGWKGLINDPGLDGTFDVNRGLRTARKLLLDISALGLPVGCEFLDPITPQFIADVVSWGSIGARTAESQVHRQLVSGLSMPVGIKNATDGNIRAAVDGMRAAAASHVFMGVNTDGLAGLVTTTGNPDTHVILRGGAQPNYSADDVAAAAAELRKAGLPDRVVVDASHGNSGKDHVRQAGVVGELAERIAAGERAVTGLMMESFLVEGRQELGQDMVRGRSVTDACMSWDTTDTLLGTLADAVRDGRH